MLQIKRRIGESVRIGELLVTHVMVGTRHALRIEVDGGGEPAFIVPGTPRSQWRLGIVADGQAIERCDAPNVPANISRATVRVYRAPDVGPKEDR